MVPMTQVWMLSDVLISGCWDIPIWEILTQNWRRVPLTWRKDKLPGEQTNGKTKTIYPLPYEAHFVCRGQNRKTSLHLYTYRNIYNVLSNKLCHLKVWIEFVQPNYRFKFKLCIPFIHGTELTEMTSLMFTERLFHISGREQDVFWKKHDSHSPY